MMKKDPISRSRSRFIVEAFGSIAGLSLLASCGASSTLIASPKTGGKYPTVLSPSQYQTMMRAMGIVAISYGGRSIIRDDMSSNANLRRDFGGASRSAMVVPVKGGGNGGVGTTSSPPPSGGSCSDTPVGGTCDGLQVISVETTSAGSLSCGYLASGSFSYFSSSCDALQGPKYAFERFGNCAGDAANEVAGNVKQMVEAILGGAISNYCNGTILSRIFAAIAVLQKGEMTAEAFELLLFALLSPEALAELVLAIGSGITIAYVADLATCLILGST